MAQEGVSDDDLRKLLDAVSLKASNLTDNQFQYDINRFCLIK